MPSYSCVWIYLMQTKIMKTAIYTILFALISITNAFSQTLLEGRVTDATTGEAILFGSVAIYNEGIMIKTVETDLDGNYSISNIEPGIYDVEASYTGYTPQKKVDIVIKKDQVNRLDFSIHEGTIIITSDEIRSFPTKKMNAITTFPSGISSDDKKGISIKGTRSETSEYYMGGERTASFGSSEKGPAYFNRTDLPESGQITVGEWNDLHNWKDWLALLEDENYSIMTERFEIFPTSRYNVIVINRENAVMANVPVQLLDVNGNILWETYTDNSGKAELWESAFENDQVGSLIRVKNQEKNDIVKIEDGSNTFVLDENCYSPEKMDIVFTVDATSSMNDEITYLKSELLDVIDRIKEINEDMDFNLGSVFYRDIKDEYLTRVSPLSPSIKETIDFVGNQNSNGGGDNPEAVEAALEETLNLSWREDALKIIFLILDAPPHEDDATMQKIRAQIKEAASRGIKLIPVTASGIGRETEFLMKFMAILTNGTYVFITDDSGIGNPHLDPVVKDYEVEKLNDCLVRLISQYSKAYSCDVNIKNEPNDIDISVYPNPSTQFINVQANSVPDKIKIFSANGMMVKMISPTEKNTRIELVDLVNGIYTISVFIGKKIESKQIILLK